MKYLKIVALLIIAVFVIFLVAQSGRPHVSVTVNGARITALESSYCWNGMLSLECVDYIMPSEQLKEKAVVPTVVSPQSIIKIKFTKQPTQDLYVSAWNNDKVGEIEILNNSITAPKESGIYVYAVSGQWSKGRASYVFSIEVK